MLLLWIREKRHFDYRHQAFTELVVCLIAILAVFVGMLMIVSVSTESVENLIKARINADSKAERSSDGTSGENIRTWREEQVVVNMASGPQTTPFTVMRKVSENAGHPDLFMGELGAGGAGGATRNLTDTSFLPDISADRRIDPISGSDFFVKAANLVKGSETNSNPLELFEGDVGTLNISYLFPVKFGALQDNVYMPAHQKK